MRKAWIAALLAWSLGAGIALGQDGEMPREEREGYLEACLAVTTGAPELAGFMRLGTGEVTRGHASVALYDQQNRHAVKVDCFFTPMSGLPPMAERVTLETPDNQSEIAPDAANALIAAAMGG